MLKLAYRRHHRGSIAFIIVAMAIIVMTFPYAVFRLSKSDVDTRLVRLKRGRRCAMSDSDSDSFRQRLGVYISRRISTCLENLPMLLSKITYGTVAFAMIARLRVPSLWR